MNTHGTSIDQLQNNQLAGSTDIVEEIMQDYENSTNPSQENMVPTYDPNVVQEEFEEPIAEENYVNYVDENGDYAVEKTVSFHQPTSTMDNIKVTVLVLVLFVLFNLPLLTSLIDPFLDRFHIPHFSLIVRTLVVVVVFYLVKSFLL